MFDHRLLFDNQVLTHWIIIRPPVATLVIILCQPIIVDNNQVNLPTRGQVSNLNRGMVDAGNLAVATTGPYALTACCRVNHLPGAIIGSWCDVETEGGKPLHNKDIIALFQPMFAHAFA